MRHPAGSPEGRLYGNAVWLDAVAGCRRFGIARKPDRRPTVAKVGTSTWGKTPRQSVEQACERRGIDAVVKGGVNLLDGKSADADLVLALGGPPADWVRTGAASGPDYWLRVWAARGLLYAWNDSARAVVLKALDDDAWRVREMALRAVARHHLHEATASVEVLHEDPSARVRARAASTLRALAN